jgi:benzoyl-CoA reductase/2-hydroxyglutaryl-CoA dehydratase subunit BcrC/BadD/HgdB
MSSILVKPFINALETKDKNLEQLASKGKNIIGYFCTYTPIEIIHASGFIPIRVLGDAEKIERADTLTPDFICPYMRLALEKGLSGGYSYLAGLIQGYTCDVTCGIMNIWKENIGGKIFYTMPIPYFDSPESRKLFRSLIMELVEKLNAIGGNFTDKSLSESINIYNQIRNHILRLYEMRYENRLPLSGGDLFYIIQAGFVTPPEDYLKLLEALILKINEESYPANKGIPVLISGSVLNNSRIIDLIEESGGKVAADDMCTGIRHFYPPSGNGNDPVDKVIDRYIRRFPCPSRSRFTDRLPVIINNIRRSRSKGVIFIFQKFCTSHLADQPILAEELKRENIPSILIELEDPGIYEGQLRTRLEAFFEMIG